MKKNSRFFHWIFFAQVKNLFFFRQNVLRPVALTFDVLNNAVQCPLPDSEPTTPESNKVNSNFNFPDNTTSQVTNHSSNIEHQCKLIQIDENNSFYLIRYTNNRPYIPCFNLARLLHLSESDILAETVNLVCIFI